MWHMLNWSVKPLATGHGCLETFTTGGGNRELKSVMLDLWSDVNYFYYLISYAYNSSSSGIQNIIVYNLRSKTQIFYFCRSCKYW